jgi:hypothetical protein
VLVRACDAAGGLRGFGGLNARRLLASNLTRITRLCACCCNEPFVAMDNSMGGCDNWKGGLPAAGIWLLVLRALSIQNADVQRRCSHQ